MEGSRAAEPRRRGPAAWLSRPIGEDGGVEVSEQFSIGDMSAEHVRAFVRACMCPWCGEGPFLVLAGHTTRVHDIDRNRLRELAGVGYSESVCDADYARRCAERPQMKDLSRLFSAPRAKTHRVSVLFAERNRQKLAAIPPEQAAKTRKLANRIATESTANAKRIATLRARFPVPEHGSRSMYRTCGCRCQKCKDGNAERHRQYLASRTK